MTAQLPPNLLRLFAPRPLPPFLEPLSKDERIRGPDKLTGISDLVKRLRSEAEDAEYKDGLETKGENGTGATSTDIEMKEPAKEDKADGVKATKKRKDPISEAGVIGQEAVKMRRELRKKRAEQYKKDLEKNWDPNRDPEVTGDPYKTLFISRLSSKATEADLMREFEVYGNIERVRILRDRKGKSKSCAFVVYERERDMKAAYKDADGIPIHHKRILVDVERGRTVKGWKPRKLGGGLGGRPKKVEAVPEMAPMAFGGRGGFRGGFRGGGGGFRGGPPGGGFRGGPPGGGGFRGGFSGPPPSRGGFGGGGGGGFGGGRGGYGGGGGFGGPGNPNLAGPNGGGAPGAGYGGYKRDLDGGSGGGGGGYGGGGASHGGYDDRDAKRPRY